MPRIQIPHYSSETVLGFILSYLRERPKQNWMGSSGVAYDLYIPDVIGYCAQEQMEVWRAQNPNGIISFEVDTSTNTAPFYDAAWSLCTRGILRPGTVYPQGHFAHAPIINAGFDLTTYGQGWLQNRYTLEIIPVEYHRFANILATFSSRFGRKYHLRSQEAVKAYQAQIYLACCVMCGAAAEAILLTLAIYKTQDEARVVRDYRTTTGRTKIERLLLVQANSYTQQELPTFTNLLKYWRDDAAHSGDTSISENESFTSLLLLLRFAQFAVDEWTELTGHPL